MVCLRCPSHGCILPLLTTSQHQTAHPKLKLTYWEVEVRKSRLSPVSECVQFSSIACVSLLTSSCSSFTVLFSLGDIHLLTVTRRKRDVTAVNSNVYVLFGEAWFSLGAGVDWFCSKENPGLDSAESLKWIEAVGCLVNTALVINNTWGGLLS